MLRVCYELRACDVYRTQSVCRPALDASNYPIMSRMSFFGLLINVYAAYTEILIFLLFVAFPSSNFYGILMFRTELIEIVCNYAACLLLLPKIFHSLYAFYESHALFFIIFQPIGSVIPLKCGA